MSQNSDSEDTASDEEEALPINASKRLSMLEIKGMSNSAMTSMEVSRLKDKVTELEGQLQKWRGDVSALSVVVP